MKPYLLVIAASIGWAIASGPPLAFPPVDSGGGGGSEVSVLSALEPPLVEIFESNSNSSTVGVLDKRSLLEAASIFERQSLTCPAGFPIYCSNFGRCCQSGNSCVR